MECLVDDTVNSNLLSGCPSCGIDSSSALRSSSELFAQCEICKRSANINNNPLLQTHRDIIPLTVLTRPRCCSCLESPTSPVTCSEQTLTAASHDIPHNRPRSKSTSNDQPLQSQTSPSECNTKPSSASHCSEYSGNSVHDCNTQSSSVSHFPRYSGNSALDHDTYIKHIVNECQETNKVHSLTEQPLKQLQESKDNVALSLDTSSDEAFVNEGDVQSCPKCGRVDSLSGAARSERISSLSDATTTRPERPGLLSDNTIQGIPDVKPVCSNINIQNCIGQDGSLPSPAEVTNTTPDNEPRSQDDRSPSRISPWSRRSPTAYSSTVDTNKHKPSSSSKHFLGAPSHADNAPKQNQRFLASEYASTSRNISHNMERNSIITTRPPRTPLSARSPRLTRQEIRLGTPSSGPSRHSLHSTGDLPRIVTPDSPMSCFPSELLYEFHGLDHENEDLSAEVVYSLHFRDYQIKELLGKGISSTVRRVTEKSSGAEYAVKIIDISGEKGEITQVEQMKKDTFREVQILRMCAGHTNIIELHDVFETPTFIFLVFEICRKGELFDYLTSVVSLSEKRTRIFMRQLFEAVAYIHDKNIVHRDLKPENILLDDNLNIKVSDFGFATVVESGEGLSELCGTPGYLAPEVLAHSMYENVSGYGREVDMWACGVIMYTLLCGAPPFWNRRQMLMLRAIMNADYTFNSPEWDDITEAPKNLIKKLLVVNPKDRLTAKEALQHPFFHSQVAEEKKFQAHRKFRAAVNCVIFYTRLSFFYKHPPPISVDTIRSNPYSVKLVRKVIDGCAFSMYKHWVKRVDNQNRAALFEHTLRDDWKHTPILLDGIRL